jgi:hypothetical protein
MKTNIPKEFQKKSRITGEIIDIRKHKTLEQMSDTEFQQVWSSLAKVIDTNNDLDYSRVDDLCKIWNFSKETITVVFKMMGGDLGETDKYLDLMNSENAKDPQDVYVMWLEETNSSAIEIIK